MTNEPQLTNAPHALTEEERKRIRTWTEQSKSLQPYSKQLARHWANCRDWHLSHGVQRFSWEAQFRIWMRRQVEIDNGSYTMKTELPREPKYAKKPAKVIPLTEALKEFQK